MRARIYEFADFRMDVGERVLSRDGKVVPLRPKLFDLLVFLIENRGRVLEKEEITRAVWGTLKQGSADSPSANLNVNISHLRHELGDDPEKPLLIETIKGRGYRFLPLAHVIESPPAKPSHPYLSAVRDASGVAKPALLSEFDALPDTRPDTGEDGVAAERVGQTNGAGAAAAAELQDEKIVSTPRAGGRKAVFFRWTLIAAAIVIAVMIIAAWAITKAGRRLILDGAKPTADQPEERPSSSAGNPAGGRFSGSQTGEASAVEPRIDSIEPVTPLAWIGDKPIKVNGRGFRPGLSVMMLFPGGGSANLTGVATLNITPESFILIADFNNNPGEYSIRVNLAEGLQSNWWAFNVHPVNLMPEIDEVKQGREVNGKRQVTVNGRNFLQSVHAVLVHPGGYTEYLPVSRASADSFNVLFDPRGQTGPFRLQAQNAGKGSNAVSFSISQP